MNIYLKRVLVTLLVILVYFTVWKGVRGFVTSNMVIPQIEYAISNCDETIAYDERKSTSLLIYLLNREENQYETYGYTAPGGFYLLFGLIFIVLAGGNRFYYYLLVGFHGIFWILSTAAITAGLCYHPLFIHFTFLGIKYLTPFATYFILILLISPKLKERMNARNKM